MGCNETHWQAARREHGYELLRLGRTARQVSEELGVTLQTAYRWARAVKQEDVVRDLPCVRDMRPARMVMVSLGEWECDGCGVSIDWDSYDEDDPPNCNYCPNCGRPFVRGRLWSLEDVVEETERLADQAADIGNGGER